MPIKLANIIPVLSTVCVCCSIQARNINCPSGDIRNFTFDSFPPTLEQNIGSPPCSYLFISGYVYVGCRYMNEGPTKHCTTDWYKCLTILLWSYGRRHSVSILSSNIMLYLEHGNSFYSCQFSSFCKHGCGCTSFPASSEMDMFGWCFFRSSRIDVNMYVYDPYDIFDIVPMYRSLTLWCDE